MSLLFILSPVTKGLAIEKYRYEFFDTFDTIVSLIGYSDSQEIFDRESKAVHEQYELYHKYFDIYNEYEDLVNLATLNRLAYESPQVVDEPLFHFLSYAKALQSKHPSPSNIALGNVLQVWHKYRTEAIENPENASLPSLEELQLANTYVSIEDLHLNETERSVSFSAPIRLDAGALAKGYTTERVAEYLENSELSSFIISAGGNVRTGKKPLDGRAYWGVGIADPNNPNALYDTIFIRENSLVTSGDYQRYYTVDGENYHHIIDPSTLFPSLTHKSVSIYTKDSGLADYLSTALFILSYEDGLALLQNFPDTEALWIAHDNTSITTPGFDLIQKSKGASSSVERN